MIHSETAGWCASSFLDALHMQDCHPQIIRGEKSLSLQGKLFRYQFTLMNKTLINPLNLLHEIIPVFTTMHCTLPVLNNKGIKKYSRKFPILTYVIRSWSLHYFALGFTASALLLKGCRKEVSAKGQRSGSNHTCLRRPCGGIVLPSIARLQTFFIAAVNLTISDSTSSLDLEIKDRDSSLSPCYIGL